MRCVVIVRNECKLQVTPGFQAKKQGARLADSEPVRSLERRVCTVRRPYHTRLRNPVPSGLRCSLGLFSVRLTPDGEFDTSTPGCLDSCLPEHVLGDGIQFLPVCFFVHGACGGYTDGAGGGGFEFGDALGQTLHLGGGRQQLFVGGLVHLIG